MMMIIMCAIAVVIYNRMDIPTTVIRTIMIVVTVHDKRMNDKHDEAHK